MVDSPDTDGEPLGLVEPREKDNVQFALKPDEPLETDLGTIPAAFTPSFFPETLRERKARELDRQRGFCGGENVSDTGSKNTEFHIQGKLVGETEKFLCRAVAAHGQAVEMVSTLWTGEVYMKEMEMEGPVGWYPPRGGFIYEYTIDVVSSGRDEPSEGRYSPSANEAEQRFDDYRSDGV